MSARDILFVTVDSLRADRVGWHGYDRPTTPFLDELSEESVVFEQAFAHACNTPYSFPTIMGSTYPSMHEGKKSFPADQRPLAAILNAAGYATAGFHSNPYLRGEFGYDRGFDTYSDAFENKSLLAQARQWVKGHIHGRLRSIAQAVFDASVRHVGFEPGSPFVPADELTDHAIQWASTQTGPPRFLWIHYMDVHHPYDAPETHQLEFRDTTINQRTAVKLRRKMLDEPTNITPEELNLINDLYDTEIRFMDEAVGRLIDTIRDAWDNPLICFTADHGEELGDHGSFSHHMPKFFDEYLHVPLVLYDGNTTRESPDLIGLMDVAPTILDYANCEIPESYLGNSLIPLLKRDDWRRESIIAEWGNPTNLNVCVRNASWKYIKRQELPGYDWPWEKTELYNLQSDPAELENVLGENPEIDDKMARIADTHITRSKSASHSDEPNQIDPAVQDRLHQLGYRE